MAEKRRGLGRGLGALIPTGNERDTRPVDVFFPGPPEPVTDVAAGDGAGTAVDARGRDGVATADGRAGLGHASSPYSGAVAGDGVPASGAPTNGAPGAAGVATGVGGPTGDARRGASPNDGPDLVPVPGARFAEIALGEIRPNPRQPRTVFDEEALVELVASVREIGVLQPVVVRPLEPAEGDARYELIMGERRWRASQQAGLATIPAIIRETGDDELLRDALLENLHRSDLNPLEEAAAYQQLLDDFSCTHDELAQRIHRSRPQITNTLRLLRLPPLVQRRVAAGVLSAGHARALLGLPDAAAMERLAQRIVAEGLSVRATEEIVALGGEPETAKPTRQAPRPGDRMPALDDLASRLSDRLDTRVKVALGKTKGRLTVEFASVQDLNRIIDVIAPDDPGLLR